MCSVVCVRLMWVWSHVCVVFVWGGVVCVCGVWCVCSVCLVCVWGWLRDCLWCVWFVVCV